ncbi:hypothetical protein RRG08_013794 [Elysia crispata]|uniref:Uncharacterized protein n=1 Tax=Elysia crispata TaxID=231223 RepID=A0AAE1BD88_9GAST|nr:hypothetical protein RRG08_013794 [Elysia crispata]
MHDPFRVIPVRHLGHGYAIAAAFGPLIYPDTHDLLTSIGTGYIILHAVHRSMSVESGLAIRALFDTLVFDCLASALIPTFITYHVRWLVRDVLFESRVHSGGLRWVPTVFSLASLVFSWAHIDRLIDDLMNQTLRSA